VSGVSRGIRVLDGVVIVEGEGAVLGNFLRSCAKVHEPIELSFGMVSEVGLVSLH